MNLNDLVKSTHEHVKNKGFWDIPQSLPVQLALITSEVSEALEEFRKGHSANYTYYSGKANIEGIDDITYLETITCDYPTDVETSHNTIKVIKPEGIPSELADIVLRVCDMCGYYGIDLEAIITIKMEYNATRGHRHGGKLI